MDQLCIEDSEEIEHSCSMRWNAPSTVDHLLPGELIG